MSMAEMVWTYNKKYREVLRFATLNAVFKSEGIRLKVACRLVEVAGHQMYLMNLDTSEAMPFNYNEARETLTTIAANNGINLKQAQEEYNKLYDTTCTVGTISRQSYWTGMKLKRYEQYLWIFNYQLQIRKK